MTLTRLLGIDRKMLPEDSERALYLAEAIWQRAGCPTEPGELAEALEEVLVRCVAEGVPYPAVLLLRKRQLQRGDWKARMAPAAGSGEQAGQNGCSLCGGSGYRLNPGGCSATLCECRGWRKAEMQHTGRG